MKIRLNEISNGVDSEMSEFIQLLADRFECFMIDPSYQDLAAGDLFLKHGAINRFIWNQGFWLIDVSGSGLIGHKRPTTSSKRGTISWNLLVSNLENFLIAAEKANAITETEINVLFGFDPVEENRLSESAKANPFGR